MSQPRASAEVGTLASIGRIARNVSAGLALSLPMAAAWVQPAQAVLIYNFYESGGNLVVEGTGSLTLPSSPFPFGSFRLSTGLLDLNYLFFTGATNLTTQVDGYAITGPTTLGASIIDFFAFSSSDSGISSGLAYDSFLRN